MNSVPKQYYICIKRPMYSSRTNGSRISERIGRLHAFSFCDTVASSLWFIQIKEVRLPSHKQAFLLIKSQHVSAHVRHHQGIFRKYTNSDGISLLIISSIVAVVGHAVA
jgi:hypothetical protein